MPSFAHIKMCMILLIIIAQMSDLEKGICRNLKNYNVNIKIRKQCTLLIFQMKQAFLFLGIKAWSFLTLAQTEHQQTVFSLYHVCVELRDPTNNK